MGCDEGGAPSQARAACTPAATTADSDADLFVVVRKEFADISDRGSYAMFVKSIPGDSLVHSEIEFEQLSRDPSSFLAQNLPTALEL